MSNQHKEYTNSQYYCEFQQAGFVFNLFTLAHNTIFMKVISYTKIWINYNTMQYIVLKNLKYFHFLPVSYKDSVSLNIEKIKNHGAYGSYPKNEKSPGEWDGTIPTARWR
jgi:hypothetical protein